MIGTINKRLNLEAVKLTMRFYALPIIIWIAIAAFLAAGAIAACLLYGGRTPWSVEFFWGLVKITCG